jgi:hypothetical protein
MPKKKKPLYLLIILIIALQACNLPTTDSAEPDFSATITAQALILQSGEDPALASTPDAGFTATPEFTATITLTPTPSVPMASVSQNTNCRTGPGANYDLSGALTIGDSAEVVGKSTSTGYWIIKTPGNAAATCWLWGQYATVTGDVSGLPEYNIPPSPTPAATATLEPPKPVKNLTANKICIPLILPNYQYTGSIVWEDKSDNEAGFNIYYNGGLFSVLGPNVVAFPIPPQVFPAGVPIKLGVQAFNDGGKSITKEVTIICP